MKSSYIEQFDQKALKLKNLLKDFYTSQIDLYPSAHEHFRMRAEFRVWHEGDDIYFYMFDKENEQKIRTDQFPWASKLINQMMIDLIFEIKLIKALRHKLFQVDFLSTLSGEILVTLIYHRQLDDEWISESRKLKMVLEKKYKVNLVGRARKQKLAIDCDYVLEKLQINGKDLIYKQVENSFTQPNAQVAIKMIEWAISMTKEIDGDLLELYCGNGNFSIALAPGFRKVLATELSSSSVEAAQFNIKENSINNLQIIRMSAEDFSDAINGKRIYNRLKGIDLKSYDCKTILVDPPRAGLDQNTLNLVQKYDNILYISCNPLSLIENLSVLGVTHKVQKAALFDQFPYTEHMECGVFLVRK